MSNENKIEFCKCYELAGRLRASLKDNERLAKTIRVLRQENDDLQTKLRNRPSGSIESRSGTTGDDNRYNKKFEAEVEINHGWKKYYEELQMRYEKLSAEKKLLEDEKRKLKERINELEKRNKFLEGEIAKLAGALYTQEGNNNRASQQNEEKEKYKHKLEDAEEIIRKLTTELDACKALEQTRRERGHYSENGYLSERGGTPFQQVQLIYPYQEVNERWQIDLHTFGNCIPDSLT